MKELDARSADTAAAAQADAAAAAQADAAAKVGKRGAPKISTKLMGLKFMQRAQAKKELSIQEKAAKKALEEERFQLESKQHEGCIVVVEEEVFVGSGRISFQNFNPDVEKINEQHKKRMQEHADDAVEKPDVCENDMANVLGKRKEVINGETDGDRCGPTGGLPSSTEQPGNRSKPKEAAAANVVVQFPTKVQATQDKPSFRSVSEGRSKKKGRVS